MVLRVVPCPVCHTCYNNATSATANIKDRKESNLLNTSILRLSLLSRVTFFAAVLSSTYYLPSFFFLLRQVLRENFFIFWDRRNKMISSTTVTLLLGFFASLSSCAPVSLVTRTQSRLDTIKSMYAWEGFVYALDVRPHFVSSSVMYTQPLNDSNAQTRPK